jgi:naphthoate synthase
MLYTCDAISAQQALDWGLVNRVVPYAQLDAAVSDLVAKIVNKFPECTRYTKQQVNFWKDFAWHQTAGHGRDWLALHYASLEPWEGMTAFVEKRPADYVGVRERASSELSSEFVWGPYTQTCTACGAKGIPESFKFCGACGAKLVVREPVGVR